MYLFYVIRLPKSPTWFPTVMSLVHNISQPNFKSIRLYSHLNIFRHLFIVSRHLVVVLLMWDVSSRLFNRKSMWVFDLHLCRFNRLSTTRLSFAERWLLEHHLAGSLLDLLQSILIRIKIASLMFAFFLLRHRRMANIFTMQSILQQSRWLQLCWWRFQKHMLRLIILFMDGRCSVHLVFKANHILWKVNTLVLLMAAHGDHWLLILGVLTSNGIVRLVMMMILLVADHVMLP